MMRGKYLKLILRLIMLVILIFFTIQPVFAMGYRSIAPLLFKVRDRQITDSLPAGLKPTKIKLPGENTWHDFCEVANTCSSNTKNDRWFNDIPIEKITVKKLDANTPDPKVITTQYVIEYHQPPFLTQTFEIETEPLSENWAKLWEKIPLPGKSGIKYSGNGSIRRNTADLISYRNYVEFNYSNHENPKVFPYDWTQVLVPYPEISTQGDIHAQGAITAPYLNPGQKDVLSGQNIPQAFVPWQIQGYKVSDKAFIGWDTSTWRNAAVKSNIERLEKKAPASNEILDNRIENQVFDLNPVANNNPDGQIFYRTGGLTLSNIQFKNKGTIIVHGNVTITGDISYINDDSSFGMIIDGKLTINKNVKNVVGAYFATGKITINGEIVK